jgi:ubiquinone/menaquinone biosynthesis C-methylase UbiE
VILGGMHPPEVAALVFFRECMDKIKASIKNYWNWRSRSYGCDADKSMAIEGRWESVLRELVSGAHGRRALDIGTGRGDFAIYLARSGFDVTGLDLSREMVSYARKRAVDHRLHINFRIGDAEKLSFSNSTFDVVVSRNLLWTLPHPDKALQEWRRVMKPGGTLVVSDGFWMNYTWKRIHHLAVNALKAMFGNGTMISLRFFYSYAGLQNSLPFYEGICFEKAGMLLQTARFKDIRSYDTSRFGMNPYGGNKGRNVGPSFFIAYAKR